MNRLLFFVLLAIIPTCRAQNADANDQKILDSLENQVNEATNDSALVSNLSLWATAFKDRKPLKELDVQKRILRVCKKSLSTPACGNPLYFIHQCIHALNIIGVIHNRLGMIDVALEHYEAGLKLAEKWHDTDFIGNLNLNIGNLYTNSGSSDEAIGYYTKAFEIARNTNDSVSMSLVKINIAVNYAYKREAAHSKGDEQLTEAYTDSTFVIIRQATQMAQNLEMLDLVSFGLSFEAYLYRLVELPDSALSLDLKALELAKQSGFDNAVGEAYASLQHSYFALDNFQKSIQVGLIGLTIGQELLDVGIISNCASALAECFEQTNEFEKALYYQELFNSIEDSLTKVQNKISLLHRSYEVEYENKVLADSISSAHQNEIAVAQIKAQSAILEVEKTQNSVLYIFLFCAFILSALMYRGYRRKQKDHALIKVQKSEAVGHQRKMTESIQYAEKIQKAVLPNPDEIRKMFPEFDVYYRPRDIVSGDFYWATKMGANSFIALADCTGHGVPGAFMSLIGSTLLKDIVIDSGEEDPAMILSRLDQGVRELLRQFDDQASDDGKEIALVKVDHVAKKLIFAGANQHLYLVGDTVQIIKSTPRGIGGYVNKPERLPAFVTREIGLEEASAFVIASDGMEDQFGKDDPEKFGRERFIRALEQYRGNIESLRKSFESWKGEIPQTDDICVIYVGLN